ncbi:hypothetical protein ACFXKD_00660 [Nocardiopsis aegyptia]|uniref:hypothetical protein n=1 Tax=Nocardiopsis aegyptia TaxID=220378 RepID=UPI00366CF697
MAVPEPPPVDVSLPFADQEHLRQGAGTFEAPYVFRSPDEYWIVVASDPRTGRHAMARFPCDPGDDTAAGQARRQAEVKEFTGRTRTTGREKAVALAGRWKQIHHEVRGPNRTPRSRPRRWPYEPKEHTAGAPIRFEADGESLTGQVWGTSPRGRHRYALTDDQRLFHVRLDTLTGQRINPGTDLTTPFSKATAAPTSEEPAAADPAAQEADPPDPPPDPLADETRPGSNYEAARRVEELLRADEFDLARAYTIREYDDPIIGPDLGKLQGLYHRLHPAQDMGDLAHRELEQVYHLSQRTYARDAAHRRAHHAEAQRIANVLSAEEHTAIGAQLQTLARTSDVERGPLRTEVLDALTDLSHTFPAQDVVALLERANTLDPAEAGGREALRARLTLPTADDPAFADALVFDHDTRTWHLPPTTPDSVRQVLHRHGFSGPYSHTDPWLTLTEDLSINAMRERMGHLYTALGQLPQTPPRADAHLWRARASAVLQEPESERRARMNQAQKQARERIDELVGRGELREALAVVHEHIAELRANAFLPGVSERSPEFEDLYLGVYAQAEHRRELLDAELVTLPDDAQTMARMAEEYRRQRPHLDEQTIAEAFAPATPRTSPAGSLDREEFPMTESNVPTYVAPRLERPRTLTEEQLTQLPAYLRKAMTGHSIASNAHGQRISLEGVSNPTKKELLERRNWMRTGPDGHLYLTEEGERVREAVWQMDLAASTPAPDPGTSSTPTELGEAAVADDNDRLFPELDTSPEPTSPAQTPAGPNFGDIFAGIASQAVKAAHPSAAEAMTLLNGLQGLDEQARQDRRMASLTEIQQVSLSQPADQVVALIDRANTADPEGALLREPLRMDHNLPAVASPEFEHVMVLDRETRTWHVTTETPWDVREVLHRHGFSGTASHTDPWLTLTGNADEETFNRILSRVYTDLSRLPDVPPRTVRPRWSAAIDRTSTDSARARRARLQAAHAQADARVSELLGEGEVSGAMAAVHEHYAELRRGAVLPSHSDSDPDFPDLYMRVADESQNRKDDLDRELAASPPLDETDARRWTDEYRRQSPHLSEQAILETVGLAEAQGAQALDEAALDLDAPAAADDGASAPPQEETATSAAIDSTTTQSSSETDQASTYSPDTDSSSEAAEETSAITLPAPGSDPAEEDPAASNNASPAGSDEAPAPAGEAPTPRAAAPEPTDTSFVSRLRGTIRNAWRLSHAVRAPVQDESTPFSESTVAANDGTSAPAEDAAAAAAPGSTTAETPPDTAPPALTAVEEASGVLDTGSDSEEIPPERQAMVDADVVPEEADGDFFVPTPAPGQEASAAPVSQPATDIPQGALIAADPGGDADEAARVATSFGNDPDHRPAAQIDLGEDISDSDGQQPVRGVEFLLSETDTSTPEEESAGPERNGWVDQLPDRGAAPDPRTINGHTIRANQRQWQSTWEKHGRAEALKATEDSVYATMREQFRAALRQDQDVRLVMPSNDPARVAEFIDMADKAGFEITLSARIHPAPIRRMQGLSQLADHFQQQQVERAALPDELRTEYDNLKTILTDAYENRSVHRIDLYPHNDNKAASSHRRVGDLNPDGTWGETTWSKHSHIKTEIHKLEEATISPTQRQWINKETMRIHQELPPRVNTHGLYRQMHDAITGTIDHLRSKQGLAQLNPDGARNVNMQAADAPTHPEHSQPEVDPHNPGPEPHPDERAQHPGVPEPRREPTGEPTPHESAPVARRRRRVDAARVDGHVNTGPVETHAAAASVHTRQPVRGRTAG